MSGLDVRKTYKLFINGAFPRSESGRVYELNDHAGEFLANPALASRKDLRDSVVAARAAQSGWAASTAYLKGQILYRIAEVAQSRKGELAENLQALDGLTNKAALAEVAEAIDALVWYAGWSDKFQTYAGSTNPVAGPFYNFTIPEPVGVVAIFSGDSLIELISAIAAVIVSGNTCVVIADKSDPLSAITLAEILATSDLPAGVVNILTGDSAELAPWVGGHSDIDAVDATGLPAKLRAPLKLAAADNLKRVQNFESAKSPTRIIAFTESKTVWHPIGL